MKRSLFIILLSVAVISVKARNQDADEREISFATTVGAGFSVSNPPPVSYAWQILGYYNLTDRWAFGVGTGLSFYEEILIPVYGDVKFQIGRRRMFTPYVEFAAGYSFATSGKANGGFFMNPSVGVQYTLTNRLGLQLAVGYEMQKIEWLKTHSDGYFLKEAAEKLTHNMISVKLGLSF